MQSILRCGPLQQKACVSRYSSTSSSHRGAPRLRAAKPKRCAFARTVLVCSTNLQEKAESATEEKSSDWSEGFAPTGAGTETSGVDHAPASSQQQRWSALPLHNISIVASSSLVQLHC